MNLRRYALFFMVAVLTFVIGVSAALLFSKVNPFSHPRQSRKGCVRLTALPDHKGRMMIYTIYRSDGTLIKSYEVDKTYGLERLGEDQDEAAPATPPAVSKRPQSSR